MKISSFAFIVVAALLCATPTRAVDNDRSGANDVAPVATVNDDTSLLDNSLAVDASRVRMVSSNPKAALKDSFGGLGKATIISSKLKQIRRGSYTVISSNPNMGLKDSFKGPPGYFKQSPYEQ